MQKSSMMFFLILAALALLGAYYATLEGEQSALLVRFLGAAAFMLLCFSLIIGPLFVFRPKEFAPLVEPRRAVGLSAFVFVLVHGILVTSLYFGWDVQTMLSFQPLLFGTIAALIIVVIATVSNDFALAKLGKWWKRIQQLNYIAFALSLLHFFFVSGLAGGPKPVTAAIYFLLGMGIVTVLMQVAGFLARRSKTAPKPQH
ncbi:MAG: ferric reductase-like transmembrane domain-containing protein [Candidatus Micrarchaeota archaeon]